MRRLLLIICFLPIGLRAEVPLDFIEYNKQQSKCKCDRKSDNFNEAVLLDIIQRIDTTDAGHLACAHHYLALYYGRIQDYYNQIKHDKIALEIRQQHQDSMLWKSYRNIGDAYVYAGFYKKGITAIKKTMELNESYASDVWRNIQISFAHSQLGEYKGALDYAHKALTSAQSDSDFGKAYNNLSIVHIKMVNAENTQLAVEYARKAIQFYEKVNWQDEVAIANINLGNALERLKNYDEAIQAYNVALKIYTKDAPFYAATQNNIAVVFNKQGKQREAIYLLNESLKVLKKYYSNTPYHLEYSLNYENLADIYVGLGEYQVAIQNYDKALDNLKDKPKSKNPYIYNKPDFIRILDLKAQALKMNGDIDLAHQIYQYIDDWITTFYKDLSSNTSKLVWIERAHKIYGNAIEVALMNGDENRAFEYAEKAHAVLLWQNLSQQSAESLLPEVDREKREDLIAKLRQAERQYQSGSIDISALRGYEKAQQEFEAQLEEQYPEYARSKYQTESTTVAQVHDMIDENTAFIEYYWTDDVLRIFTITKNGLTVQTETAEGLADQIGELRSIISQPKCYADCAKNTYNPLAFNLYKKLIPKKIQENTEINRLVIVADKAIGTLPFSALATQVSTANFDVDYPFLLQKYATNYLYSAGSFLQFQQKNTHDTKGFAGFAPVEYHIPDREFLPLYKTKQEVKEIAQLYPRRQRNIYMEADANKENFIKALQANYHTILLATHAQYSNSKGEIAFRGEVMSQNEIDQLSHISIQRLMLSACQTAEGKQNAGEGVLSLGWNFAYKGVPSITMNQWSVSEKATKQIMVAYNEYLQAGTPADQALRTAQIKYLKDGKHQPCYWAAIIHVGNPDDVSTALHAGSLGEVSWEWILIGLLIGLLGYAVVRRN